MISSEILDEFTDELTYAFERVPFYTKHLGGAGLNPDDILFLDDICNVPPTEKLHYRRNFPLGVLAEGYKLSDDALVKSQSSGTSGDRLVTYEVGMLLMQRALECSKLNKEVEKAFSKSPRKICRYAAPNCSDVECANPNSTTQDRMLSDGTLVLPVYHDLLTTSEELIDTALREICEYQPDLYYVDPTHFAYLLRKAEQKGVILPAAPIVTTYTALHPLNRKQIKELTKTSGFSGNACAQLVSSSEMGWIAMECEHGCLHLNTNSFFMELLIDKRYVREGEVGELYITSKDQGAIPHIRYKTGDVFKYLGRQCACGRTQPQVEMQGRLSNLVTVNGTKSITPSDIFNAIGKPDWLDLYQLEFNDTACTQAKLRLSVNPLYEKGNEKKLISELDRVLSRHTAIESELVSYIASDRSGKFQSIKMAQ